MSVRRIMGTETEYAVSAPKLGHYNPVQLSFDVVGAAANERTKHIRWDYRQEDPVNDARGTRLERAAAVDAAPVWNAPPPARTCSPTPRSSTSPT